MPNNKKLEHMIIGAVSNGVLDGGLEVYFEMIQDRNHPLFQHPIEFLPPVDDWVVAGAPVAVYALGKGLKNKSLQDAALGGVIYGGAVFLARTMVCIYRYLHKEGVIRAEASGDVMFESRRPTVQKTAPQPQPVLLV